MKTKIISKILLSLGLAFVLVSAITEVHGGNPASSGVRNKPSGWGGPGCHDPEHWERDPGKNRFIRPTHGAWNAPWNLRKLLCQRLRYPN